MIFLGFLIQQRDNTYQGFNEVADPVRESV